MAASLSADTSDAFFLPPSIPIFYESSFHKTKLHQRIRVRRRKYFLVHEKIFFRFFLFLCFYFFICDKIVSGFAIAFLRDNISRLVIKRF